MEREWPTDREYGENYMPPATAGQQRPELKHRREMGKRLAQVREAAGLTQLGLANLKFQKKATIAHQEAGRAAMRSFDVILFAKLLRCDPAWLLTGKGDPYEGVE